MLKAILLCAILLTCAGVGRILSNNRRRRYERLSEILAAMRVLRLRMLNSMEPIGILLRKSDAQLFSTIGNDLREGACLRDCWREVLADETRYNRLLGDLSKEDMRILNGFFDGLGKSGREEQKQLFTSVIAEMEEVQSAARARYCDASKVYTALGTLVGIGICILII